MLMNIAVQINESSLSLSYGNLITGEIYFQIGSHCFPGRTWNDFVDVILRWWVQSFIKLTGEVAEECEFLFMDGPFLARAVRVGSDKLSMQFVERGETERVVLSATGNLHSFKDSIVTASNRIIQIAESRCWDSKDIDELKAVVKSIAG